MFVLYSSFSPEHFIFKIYFTLISVLSIFYTSCPFSQDKFVRGLSVIQEE